MFSYCITIAFRTTETCYAFLICIVCINEFQTTSQTANPLQVSAIINNRLIYLKPGGYNKSINFSDFIEQLIITDGGAINYLPSVFFECFNKNIMHRGCYENGVHKLAIILIS